MKPAFIDQLLEKISNVLPKDWSGLKEDTQKNIRGVLNSVFEKMDLVTREDFEVQKKILLRAQERIQHLEQELDAIKKAIEKS